MCKTTAVAADGAWYMAPSGVAAATTDPTGTAAKPWSATAFTLDTTEKSF